SIEVIRPSAEAKHIQVSVDTNDYAPSPIEGDPERLQQILLNLLTNAVKFTPENGRIDIILRRINGNVEIEVKDNGYGIEPRFLPFIFERFRQADSKHTRRTGGLGLGLAIVWHLVEMHGGNVSAHSEGRDQGTSFIVRLPVSKTAVENIPSTAVALETSQNGQSGSPLTGLRILIVEDDDDSRDMLATILKFHGADVLTAENVPDGFETFRSTRPDILISDVGLPEKDGYDLIRHIRSLPKDEGGQTPAIALTGYAGMNDQLQALRAGYQEHLAKPIDTEKLISAIVDLSKVANSSRSVVTTNS